MKSSEYPVVIDGRTYMVDETFGGGAAVYEVTKGGYDGEARVTHVSGGPDMIAKSLLARMDEGRVIIIARLPEAVTQEVE